jgi:hypothetical protein
MTRLARARWRVRRPGPIDWPGRWRGGAWAGGRVAVARALWPDWPRGGDWPGRVADWPPADWPGVVADCPCRRTARSGAAHNRPPSVVASSGEASSPSQRAVALRFGSGVAWRFETGRRVPVQRGAQSGPLRRPVCPAVRLPLRLVRAPAAGGDHPGRRGCRAAAAPRATVIPSRGWRAAVRRR